MRAVRSDQGSALTDRVTANEVDAAGNETSGHARGQAHADEVPSDRVANDVYGAGGVRVILSQRDVDQRRVPANRVEEHAEPVGGLPGHREVTVDGVVLDGPRNRAAPAEQRDVSVDFDPVQQNEVRAQGSHVALDQDGGYPIGRLDARMSRLERTSIRVEVGFYEIALA